MRTMVAPGVWVDDGPAKPYFPGSRGGYAMAVSPYVPPDDPKPSADDRMKPNGPPCKFGHPAAGNRYVRVDGKGTRCRACETERGRISRERAAAKRAAKASP